ncbi:MAG: hypothetical protein QOD99_246 [Chthoniobacter sp.]|nr:hypothetical protein [Chthoniobacter sp.]
MFDRKGVRKQCVLPRQRIDIGRIRVANDLGVTVVFFDYDHDVVKGRQRTPSQAGKQA